MAAKKSTGASRAGRLPDIGAAVEKVVERLSARSMERALAPIRDAIADLRRELQRLGSRPRGARGAPAGGRRSASTRTGETMTAAQVKALRGRLGLSQAEFARLAGVTSVAVYLWESGRTSPRGRSLESLEGIREMGAPDARRRLEGGDVPERRRRAASPKAGRKSAGSKAASRKKAGARKKAARKTRRSAPSAEAP